MLVVEYHHIQLLCFIMHVDVCPFNRLVVSLVSVGRNRICVTMGLRYYTCSSRGSRTIRVEGSGRLQEPEARDDGAAAASCLRKVRPARFYYESSIPSRGAIDN